MPRKCLYKGVCAYFHAWSTVSCVVDPSPMIGGHPGGQVSRPVAIIEVDGKGTVKIVDPNDIVFVDPVGDYDLRCNGEEQRL